MSTAVQRLRVEPEPSAVDLASLCFDFYAGPEAPEGASGGDGEAEELQLALRLPLCPRVVFDAHLDDLAFLVARLHPGLEGAELDVQVCFRVATDDCLYPWLVAVGSHDGPAEDGRLPGEVAAVPVLPETLDLRPLLQMARQRGLSGPGTCVRIGVGPTRAPAPTPRRRLFGGGPAEAAGLSVRVPVIPRWEGPDPELDPELFTAGPPPVVMPAESLEALIRDELAFSEARGPDWSERGWWLMGAPRRVRGGVCVRIELVPEMEGLEVATQGRFVIGSSTWDRMREAHPDRAVVGWLHTHGMSRLRAAAEGELEEPASGLFLSREDVYSARYLGFRAPWMVTAVLDSDSVVQSGAERAPTDEVLGAWGWLHGLLVRRPVVLLPATPA